jgi:hypothetical protein
MKTETEQKTRYTIIYFIMIIIIMRGENFVAHLDGLGGTPVCRGTPVAHHCLMGSACNTGVFQDAFPYEPLCVFPEVIRADKRAL